MQSRQRRVKLLLLKGVKVKILKFFSFFTRPRFRIYFCIAFDVPVKMEKLTSLSILGLNVNLPGIFPLLGNHFVPLTPIQNAFSEYTAIAVFVLFFVIH